LKRFNFIVFKNMGRNDRPEHSAPPEIFYNDDEARKYTDNTRIINIQRQLTERALELLALPNDGSPKFLLDLGCGSGLSGEALTDQGHIWMVSIVPIS
jgi:18S rRNA (guanine1575-N7)-methyltransferase